MPAAAACIPECGSGDPRTANAGRPGRQCRTQESCGAVEGRSWHAPTQTRSASPRCTACKRRPTASSSWSPRRATPSSRDSSSRPTTPIRYASILLSTYAENVYDQAGIAAAVKATEEAQAAQSRGSLADICLLIGRGLLQYRQDREDLAIGSLTQAYRSSTTPAFDEPRRSCRRGALHRAARHGRLSAGAGPQPGSHRLGHGAACAARAFGRSIFARQNSDVDGKVRAAPSTSSTRRASSARNLNDTQGVAFADVRICEARVELGQLIKARAACENALFTFIASRFSDEVKETEALLARIDLAEGHPEKALATLNEVLDHSGTDVLPLARRLAVPMARAHQRRAAQLPRRLHRPVGIHAPLHGDQRFRSHQAGGRAARALRDRSGD